MPHSSRAEAARANATTATPRSPVPPDYPTAKARLTAERRNREWLLLEAEVQAGICALVGECRRVGRLQIGTFYAGDTYANAHTSGGILWGVNGEHGFISAHGIHQIPADLPVAIDSHAALTETAQRGAAIMDADAATVAPEQAKNLLAAGRTQHAAGLRFLRGRIERGEEADAAHGHVELIGQRIEALGRAIHSRAADDAWRRAFDAAGWQTDMSILLRPPHEAIPAAFPRSADG